MTISSHIRALEEKHYALEKQLTAALAAPAADDLQIVDLKRKKLHIKDEIEQLKMRTA